MSLALLRVAAAVLTAGALSASAQPADLHAPAGAGATDPDRAPAVDSAALRFAETITVEDLRRHLAELASDEYEGRETGHPGQKKAARYIAAHFRGLDLESPVEPGYFQRFHLVQDDWGEVFLEVDGERYEFLEDFYGYPGTNPPLTLTVDEIVFAGFGIHDERYSDYAGLDVRDRIVLVFAGEPQNKDGIYLVTGADTPSTWSSRWRTKLEEATERGARALLVAHSRVEDQLGYPSFVRYLAEPDMEMVGAEEEGPGYLNTMYVPYRLGAGLLDMKEKKFHKLAGKIGRKERPMSEVYEVNVTLRVAKEPRRVETENVLAWIGGTDLAGETVVITAHYDHIGRRDSVIFNGADDDGSGTVAVMEIAEAMAAAAEAGHGPRRNVLFMTVSGEEKGLLGSAHYVHHPVVPLEETVTNLNIDMIGRVDPAHEENRRYVYVIGSDRLSSDLHRLSETAASTYSDLELDYTYSAPDDPNRFYERSDHYNFAERGIPVIFYFNGTHEDYHGDDDVVEKIQFDLLRDRTRLVFHTLWAVANADERPAVDAEFDPDDE